MVRINIYFQNIKVISFQWPHNLSDYLATFTVQLIAKDVVDSKMPNGDNKRIASFVGGINHCDGNMILLRTANLKL